MKSSRRAAEQTRIGTLDLRKIFDDSWKAKQADAALKDRLTATHSGNSVTVSWPYSSSGWTSQQNAGLNSANWAASGFTISTNGTINSITIAPPAGDLFFRLVK